MRRRPLLPFLLLAVASSASAADYTLSVSRGVASSASEAVVDVRLSHTKSEIAAVAFVLRYDPAKIEIAPATNAASDVTVQPPSIATNVSASGAGRTGIVLFDPIPPIDTIPSGTAVSIRFRILDARGGWIPITIEDAPDASDRHGKRIPAENFAVRAGGIAIAPTRASLRAEPASIELGEMPTRAVASRKVTILNDGNHELDITAAYLRGEGPFRIAGEIPRRLAAGAAETITIEFDGSEPALHNAELVIETSVAAMTLRLPMSVTVLPEDVRLLGSRFLIPAVARIDGANGSRWLTEASFHNPSESEHRIRITPLSGGGSIERTIASRATIFFEDLYGATGRNDAFNGAMLVESSSPELLIAAATVNAKPGGGRLAQTVPAIAWKDLFHGSERARLQTLRNDPNIRTNLTLINAGMRAITLKLTARDEAGALIGESEYVMGPAVIRNATDFLARSSSGRPVTITIEADLPGAVFHAYASEVDSRTGAPLFQSAR